MFLRRFRDSGVEESSLTQNLSKLERRVQENASLTRHLQALTAELEERNDLDSLRQRNPPLTVMCLDEV